MDKKEFIKRQISRTNRKDYENYVTTRIINFLNDLDIKFITQQYIKRKEGYALADLYFPQINYIVEIDEMHHLDNAEADKIRDCDIEDAIGIKPKRIDVADTEIEAIHNRIDEIVSEIKGLVQKQKDSGKWTPWRIEDEISPDFWVQQGKISVEDKVSFYKIVDACKCMGLNYNGYQRAGANHPYEANTLIWFPKLYKNDEWENSYDSQKGIICTKNIKSDAERIDHVQKCIEDPVKRRIVFARVEDNLGDTKYRFRGVFEMDLNATSNDKGVVWNRVADWVNTYEYKNKPVETVN